MIYQFPHERFEARLSGCCIERADSRDRNTGGRSTGNASGGSHGERTGAAGAGRAAAANQKNNFPGYRGPIGTSNPDTSSAGVDNVGHGLVDTGRDTPYGTRVFEDWGGNPVTQGTQVARSPEWKDAVDKYNKAAKDWNDNRVLNTAIRWALPFGLGNVAPRWDQPSSFADGSYHFGMNPAAAVGGVVGGLTGIPGLGMAAGKAYSMAGLKDVVLGGPGAPDNNFTGGPVSPSSDPGQGMTSNSQHAGGNGAGLIPGPIKAPPSIMNPAQPPQVTPPGAQPQVPIFTRRPTVQSRFAVPGGSPYGFSIFGQGT